LLRIFTNLLSNAITYACSKMEVSSETTGGTLLICFKDDGPGIPKEHLARLGERFYRPEAARSRSQGGTGLGLAIVKSLCQAHGGELTIESTVGEGATATVVLPLTPR
jgi:two-component system phosphate regulon sensor histidine kinase PhoR